MILYTTHCPKCKVLELKMKQKGINYTENENIQDMLSKGIHSAPAIEYNGEIYLFSDAVKLVNSL